MIQPQVPLCSACDKGGPVTAFANDGSYWPNMGRFCPNFPSLGEYREKHAYYISICYIHQMPWAPRPAKFLGPNLRKKWTLCLWLETWGIYLVNQYVICTQPVLCQYRPILWNGVSLFSCFLEFVANLVKNCLGLWNRVFWTSWCTSISEQRGTPSKGCGIPFNRLWFHFVRSL